MNLKGNVKKEIDRINANHQYKMIFHEQKNGLISLHAWYRQNKALHKKSLNLTLENKTTPNAKFKDAETLRKADELLTLLDKQMERKLSGKLIERDFLEFFEMCIDKPTKEGKIRTDGTKKNWRGLLKHLRLFIKETYKKDDISFDIVNYVFFSTLHSWIVNNFKQYSANSKWSIIKKFVKYAVLEERINDANLLLKIQSELIIKRPKIERTEKDFLSLIELQKMINFPYYPRYKIPFIFNCYVGLRISDLKKLSWNNFNKDFTEIDIIEKKTGKQYQAPLHKFASGLLIKLNEKRDSDNDLVFDLPIDDWKTNKHIKKWAILAGLDKKMSSHIMRRTFLNLMEWSGVALSSSSKLLNHSSVKITEQYYLAQNKDLLRKELEKLPGVDLKNLSL